jgi:hypothetical protein
MRTLAERERRLRTARIATGIELLLGGLALAIVAFAVVLFPPPQHFNGGGVTVPMILGALGVVVGFVWMLRIRFRGPEDRAKSNWRSH